MALLNENKLKFFIRDTMSLYNKNKDKEIQKLWDYINNLRQEVKCLEAELNRIKENQ
jgi:polyhydroxyalkanoate synthesis regulator phasin